jgi:hypothetical protein
MIAIRQLILWKAVIFTPCSLILSDSHLSNLRYSLLEARQARSITKANGVAFSSIDKAWKYNCSNIVWKYREFFQIQNLKIYKLFKYTGQKSFPIKIFPYIFLYNHRKLWHQEFTYSKTSLARTRRDCQNLFELLEVWGIEVP